MKDPLNNLMIHCVNCGRDEEETPLVVLRYKGYPAHICPQCFPILIHNPARLAEHFPGLANLPPNPHED